MLYFLKFKDLTCNFCTFSRFFIFLSQFLPDLNKNFIKIYRKCRATGLPSRLGPEPVLGPRSFPVYLKKIERTGTVGPLEPVTVRSGSRSLSGPTNRTLKH